MRAVIVTFLLWKGESNLDRTVCPSDDSVDTEPPSLVPPTCVNSVSVQTPVVTDGEGVSLTPDGRSLLDPSLSSRVWTVRWSS